MPQNTDFSPGLQAPHFWLLAAVVPLWAQTQSSGKLLWLWTLRTNYPLFPKSQVFNLKTQGSQTLHQDLLGSNPNSERVTLRKFLSHFVGWWNTCLPELRLNPKSLCIHIHFYISHVDKLRLQMAVWILCHWSERYLSTNGCRGSRKRRLEHRGRQQGHNGTNAGEYIMPRGWRAMQQTTSIYNWGLGAL